MDVVSELQSFGAAGFTRPSNNKCNMLFMKVNPVIFILVETFLV